MKIAVTTRYNIDVAELTRALRDVELVVVPDGDVPPLPDVEACLGGNDPRRFRAILAAAPQLRWYHTVSAGVDTIMPELMRHRDLLLTNNSGSYDAPIAEFVLGMIFAAAKRVPVYQRDQREHRWRDGAAGTHAEVRDAVLVIVGMGSIGTEVARLARGVGMHVIGVRRSARPDPHAERVVTPDGLAEVAREADYLAVTAALTPETTGLVSRDVIAAMRPTAWLVNIARGAVVDESALLAALRAKRIGGAAIDAWWVEPLPADSPWWDLDNVIVTPHRSNSSPRLRERTLALFAENLRRYRGGVPLLNVVDRKLGY